MAKRLVIRPAADDDHDTQVDYLAERSLELAVRFQDAVAGAYARLTSMPDLGARRDHLGSRLEGLRVWPVPEFPNYLIYYLLREATLEVVRLLHAARDLIRRDQIRKTGKELDAVLHRSVASIERGEGLVVTPGFWAELRSEVAVRVMGRRSTRLEGT
ncbi:MAG: type II toxin-antitoxin system RelE/ParE family toxin [Candidatus Eisenbacteria bacterium]|nr:type II toxin-antitoxin system RelE/ParE family toxin [Candidatus Eisenbacteria bacterium]